MRTLADSTKTDGHQRTVLLIVTDEDESARILGELSSETEERFRVEWVTEIDFGIERLRAGGVEATVLDFNLQGSQDAENFDELLQTAPSVPILILTDVDTEAMARRAIHRGAHDYLLKKVTDGYRTRRTVRSMINSRLADAVALEYEIAFQL